MSLPLSVLLAAVQGRVGDRCASHALKPRPVVHTFPGPQWTGPAHSIAMRHPRARAWQAQLERLLEVCCSCGRGKTGCALLAAVGALLDRCRTPLFWKRSSSIF